MSEARRSPRRPPLRGSDQAWLTGLALLLAGLTVSWTLASPAGGAPDEEAHVVYAWGMADGQVLDEPVRERSVSGPGGLVFPTVEVEVPAGLVRLIDSDCHAFQPERAASDCTGRQGPPDDRPVTELTYMARYPPAYYVVVGWALRAGVAAGLDGPSAVLLARAVSGAWAVGALFAAAILLRRVMAPAAVLASVLLATAPLALFVSAAVNPNGVEVAVTVLASAAVVVLRAGAASGAPCHRPAMLALALAAPVVALVRPTSVVWLGVLMAAMLLPVRLPSGRLCLPARRVPLPLTAWVVACAAAGLAWLAWAAGGRGLGWADSLAVPWGQLPPAERLLLVLMRYTGAGLEYVGVFGWVDTPLPAGLAVAWLMAVAAVLGLAVATEPVRRPAEWLVGLAVLAAGMSAIVLHTMTSGFGWQPRYVLPVLASALVVAAGSLASVAPATGAVRTGPRRVLLAAASVAVTVHAVSPLWTFARYRWGFSQLSPHFPAVPVPRPAAEGVDLLWEPVLGPSGMLALGLGSLLVGTVVVALVALVVPAGAAAPVPSLAPPADSGRPSGVSDRAPAPPGGSGRSRSSRWPRPADAARRR